MRRVSILPRSALAWVNSLLKNVFLRSSVATSAEIKQIGDLLVQKNEVGKVRIGKSSVLEGGSGVFATQDIRRGELVTLYAGIQFPQPPLKPNPNPDSLSGKAQILIPDLETNDYIINLSETGAGYIDGHNADVSSLHCGQIVNHPPSAIQPNVDMIEFLWKSVAVQQQQQKGEEGLIMVKERAKRINSLYQGPWFVDEMQRRVHTPSPRDPQYWSLLAGCALVASRDLAEGEELWLDYQLNVDRVDVETKAWYAPVPFEFL
jgi:hypothetical protein